MLFSRTLSVIVLGLLLASPAVAQISTPAPDSTLRFRHQLGLTASPQLEHISTANRNLPIGLLYKYQVKPGHFLRVRLVGAYSRRDTSIAYPTSFISAYTGSTGPDSRSWEVSGFVGYERQYALGHRFRLGYGVEAGGGYYRLDSPYYRQEIIAGTATSDPFVVTDDGALYAYRWMLQARLLGSLTYALNRRLTLFAETSIAATYSKQTAGGDYKSYASGGHGVSPGGIFPTVRNTSLTIGIRPIQFIGIAVGF